MSDQLIDPSGIPHFIGDLATLDTDVTNLSTHAGEFRSAGADVHTEFQGLSAFYQAPEADQLFATTLPVKTKTDAFADDLEKVSSALSAYSTEVQPLVKKLNTLKADATAFVNSVSGDDDWRKDQDKVDHNNDLWHDVNHTVAAFQSAERAAYNKIMALIGGTALTTDDGSHAKNMYGFKAGDLDHAEETPWGSSAEREYEGLAWLGHQIKSYVWDGFIVDGVWGTITGLGTLVGTDGWAAAGQAWKHLAQLGTGLAITSTAMFGGAGVAAAYWTAPDDKLPTWLRESRTTMKETGKALVAWDTWKTNPSRAAGAVTFNAVTTIFTGGAGGAASGAGKAGAVARALSITGKAARIVDPMTYVGKAGKFAFVKVGDTFTALKNLRTGASIDLIRQADAVRSPTIPETAIPYVDNATGKVVYLTDQGHLLDADGSLHGSAAKVEMSAADRAALDSTPRTSVPGTHSPGLVTAHAGDGLTHGSGNGATVGRSSAQNSAPPTGDAAGSSGTRVAGGAEEPPTEVGRHGDAGHGPSHAADSPGSATPGSDAVEQHGRTEGGPDTAHESAAAGGKASERINEPLPALTPEERAAHWGHLEDVEKRSPDDFDHLQRDPDKNGGISDPSKDEARVGLDLRDQGRLPSDIRRPAEADRGEFYSPSTGRHYDIKGVHSYWPPFNNVQDPAVLAGPFRGAYNPAKNGKWVLKLSEQIVDKNRTVILDVRNANQAAIDNIKSIIETNGWEDNVIWYP
ncbi:ADP-ribosyltransferase [Streptomyces fractus]|uniref:ADP-ribosyltransferase n=1 Tax=Streptomyces fractus TaxID=641806 RepID=UPI003CF95697